MLTVVNPLYFFIINEPVDQVGNWSGYWDCDEIAMKAPPA